MQSRLIERLLSISKTCPRNLSAIKNIFDSFKMGQDLALLDRIQDRLETMRQTILSSFMDLVTLREQLYIMSADFDQYPPIFSPLISAPEDTFDRMVYSSI